MLVGSISHYRVILCCAAVQILALFFLATAQIELSHKLLIATFQFLSLLLCVFICLDQKKQNAKLKKLSDQSAAILKIKKAGAGDSKPDLLTELESNLKELGSKLRDSQNKENTILSHALDVICSIGPDQSFISMNPASKKAWGYSPDELIGKNFSDLIVEEDLQSSLQTLLGAEKSVDTLRCENRVRRKDGTVLYFLWSAHWSAADNALFCVAHDITARKNAERLIEESEARIRQILEDMPVGLLIANRLGLIELSNPGCDALVSYDKDELVGKHIQKILPDLFKTQAAPDFKKLVGVLTDTSVMSKSSENKPVHVSASELIIGGDKQYLLILVDTSEKEKLEQLKREFFAMVNHDLRSPLTSLLSVLDALPDGVLGQLTEKGAEVVKRNAKEVERLITLVDELLDIEKMQAGKFIIEAEHSPLDAIVDTAISSLENISVRRDIKIDYSKSAVMVFADRSLLIRVLVNLLSNALKFSPKGAEIKVRVEDHENELLLSVQDSGPGVADEFKDLIFEQYQQAKKPEQEKKSGTGLGLSICRKIVEQHGGRIWVEDAKDKGSIFKFTIPKHDMKLD